jgi:hypothetical protein
MFAEHILSRAQVSDVYGIYQLQTDWDRPAPIYMGEVMATSAARYLQEQERIKSMAAVARTDTPHVVGKASCIADSLPFAQRFFQRFDADEFDYELMYLSDMMENCDSRLFGRKIMLESSFDQLPKDVALREKVDLSTVRITVVVPAALVDQKLPSLQDLQTFWIMIFRQCRIPPHAFSDSEQFHFSPFLPQRFN